MHADEIMYLFTMPIPHNETEIELSKKMIEVWTTFATHGQVLKKSKKFDVEILIIIINVTQQGTDSCRSSNERRNSKLASIHQREERIHGHQ